MEKLKLFFLTMILSLTACSSDDDSGNLKVTHKSISGKWYFSQLVRADGSIVNHVGNCSTYRDLLEIYEAGNMISRIAYASCASQSDELGCYNFYILSDQNNKIIACNNTFDDGHITQLTKDKMKIELSEPKLLGMGMGTAKAFIFTRK